MQYFSSDRQENFAFKGAVHGSNQAGWLPSHAVSRQLRVPPLSLAKVTSSLMVSVSGDSKVNLGLNLKFEAKSQKVLGYTRKTDGGWEYSPKAVKLVSDYKVRAALFQTTVGCV